MDLTITFNPGEAAEAARIATAIGELNTTAEVTEYPEHALQAVIARAKPGQQPWFRQRVEMCHNGELRISSGNSKNVYLRAYDPDGPHPSRSIITLHPERSIFWLPATVTAEYDGTSGVYGMQDDERVGYRGKDPQLFADLMERTIAHTRS